MPGFPACFGRIPLLSIYVWYDSPAMLVKDEVSELCIEESMHS